mgnify:CR=1 FL=1
MRLTTVSELRDLTEVEGPTCVSILMPTVAGADYDKNRIRFKTLVGRAEKLLECADCGSSEAEELLRPARQLITERPFWKASSRGLAMYLAPGVRRTYRLPFEPEERANVGERFLTRPLVRLVARERRYMLLALGLGDNRLFEATPHTIREIPAENLPEGISETLRFDVFEKHLQGHATARASGSGARMTFHGHGSSKEDRTSQVSRYVHGVARGITALLAGETAPLVVATLPYLLPVFRSACGYTHLANGSVAVDPGHMDVGELHRRSLEPAESVFAAELDQALERYGDAAAGGEASSDPAEVVLAAVDGRVSTLLLAEEGGLFGRLDRDSRKVEVREEPQEGDTDLADLAAARTLLTGGRVLSVPRERMPNRVTLAAIMRY